MLIEDYSVCVVLPALCYCPPVLPTSWFFRRLCRVLCFLDVGIATTWFISSFRRTILCRFVPSCFSLWVYRENLPFYGFDLKALGVICCTISAQIYSVLILFFKLSCLTRELISSRYLSFCSRSNANLCIHLRLFFP